MWSPTSRLGKIYGTNLAWTRHGCETRRDAEAEIIGEKIFSHFFALSVST